MYTFLEYVGAMAITPNDSQNLARRVRGISVNETGDVKLTLAEGSEIVLSCQAGIIYHGLAATKIFLTGTSANGIIGYW